MDPIGPPSLSEVWLGLGLFLSERGATHVAVADNRLLDDIETLHLDRGYDYPQCATGLPRWAFTTCASNAAAQYPTAPTTHTPRTALDSRIHQLLAVQLRTTPTQHRPPQPIPPRRPMRSHHHRQTTQLPKPMVLPLTAYPRKP